MLLYIVYSGTLAQEISFSVHIRVCLNEMDRKGFLKMETQQRCRLRYEQGRNNFVSYCVSAALFSFLLQCFLKLFTPRGHRITGTQSIMRQCGVTPHMKGSPRKILWQEA